MKLLCLLTVTGSEKSANELVQLLLLRSNLLPPKWCRLAGLQISNSELFGQQVTVTTQKYWKSWSSCNITFPDTCQGAGNAEGTNDLSAWPRLPDWLLREEDPQRWGSCLQGTRSVKKKSCWSLLNDPHSFEKVVSKPWRKDHRHHLPGEFFHAPGAKLVPQLSADLAALMQGCLKGERCRQSEAAALPGSLLAKHFGRWNLAFRQLSWVSPAELW